jgi:putative ABC transport system permease protein
MGLVLSGLWRNPTRNVLTIMSIVIAFLLFGLLKPVSEIFESGPKLSGSDRLIVSPRHSITDMLPIGHVDQIRQVPGVKVVAHQTWFGGTYKDPANSFFQYAVPAKEFMAVYEDVFMLPEAQLDAFINTRTGAIAGREIADEFNMKVGDKLPFIPNIWYNRDYTQWEFDLVGIYEGNEKNADTRRFLFNFSFFDEYRAFGNGLISNILVSVEDPDQTTIIAGRIDELFANSRNETDTTTEREYVLGFAKQLGDIGLIVNAILLAVFFTILSLTANTMSQGIRDRIPELAILKTLGFQEMTILWLILGESVFILVAGALFGLGLAAFLLLFAEQIMPATSQMGTLSISIQVFISGVSIAVLIGILVGLAPAIQAKRVNIINALRS